MTPDRTFAARPVPRTVTTHLVAVVVAAGAYWALLGWDTAKTAGADGNLHGPYQPWQVLALIAVVGALAIWSGHRRSNVGVALTVATVLAMCEAVSGVRDPYNDGLWPIGVILVFIGTFAGVALTSALARRFGDVSR